MNAIASMPDQDSTAQCQAERFLHHEALLLDAASFSEWLELFAPDGLYWVPSMPGQTDPLGVPSIMYEDRSILAMRVRRLNEARALVMTPMPRTTHLVTNIELLAATPSGMEARACFMVVEFQDGRQRLFAGRYHYRLVRNGAALRIGLKRVDLLGCDGAHGPITVPL